MAKLLTDETAAELPAIFEAVRNMQQETHTRPRRRIRSLGGGTRSYVSITSITIPGVYVGDVLTSPTDITVLKSDVDIVLLNATNNALEVGDAAFADMVAGDSGDVYYLQSVLLS